MTGEQAAALAPRLLLCRAQRAVGRVGVLPSTPINANTRRKRLKTKTLNPFQNGAILPSGDHRQGIGAKGKRLGKLVRSREFWLEALELQLMHLSKYTFGEEELSRSDFLGRA